MPAEKCSICQKFISAMDSAVCGKCGSHQHRSCVALPLKGKLAASWTCPGCRKDDSNDHRKASVSPTTQLSIDKENEDNAYKMIFNELKAMRAVMSDLGLVNEIRAFRQEFLDFRNEVSQLKAEIKTCHARIEELEDKVKTMDKHTSSNEGSYTPVDEAINQLRMDLNERDQLLLANDIEIQNIPEEKEENRVHLVGLAAARLGVKIEDRDIISAERIGRPPLETSSAESTEMQPRPIIARLARRELREQLLISGRSRRNAGVGGFGEPRRIYINERLTRTNKLLLRQAREAARTYSWQYIWIRKGRILARRKPGETVLWIRCDRDIIKNIGPAAESS